MKTELWEVLQEVERFLHERLHLSLHSERTSVRPVAACLDFLGYVVYPNGSKRIRRRNVVNGKRLLLRMVSGETGLSRRRAS